MRQSQAKGHLVFNLLDDQPPPKADMSLRPPPTIDEVLETAAEAEEEQDPPGMASASSSDDGKPQDTETSEDDYPNASEDEKEETLNVHYLLTKFQEMADELGEEEKVEHLDGSNMDNTVETEVIHSLETWPQDCKEFSGTKKLVWEVFVDKGQTSKECLRYDHVEV